MGRVGCKLCAAGARYATLFISPCCMLPFPSTFDQSSPARWYLKKFPKTPGQPGTHRPIDPGTRVDRTMERWLGWGLRVKKTQKKKKTTEKVGHLFRSTELGPWVSVITGVLQNLDPLPRCYQVFITRLDPLMKNFKTRQFPVPGYGCHP